MEPRVVPVEIAECINNVNISLKGGCRFRQASVVPMEVKRKNIAV